MNNLGYRGLSMLIISGLLIGWLFASTRADLEEPLHRYTIAGLVCRGLRGTWMSFLILFSAVVFNYGLGFVLTEGFVGLFYVVF